MIEALPKDKRNYLHVKLKKNPGHYSQTLLKEIDGEKYDEEAWMQKMYNNEPDWYDGTKADQQGVVDSISAPASKAVWKTKYSPANEMDSLLYQRERHIMNYSEYQLWREQLDEEGEELREQNMPTYYTTTYDLSKGEGATD